MTHRQIVGLVHRHSAAVAARGSRGRAGGRRRRFRSVAAAPAGRRAEGGTRPSFSGGGSSNFRKAFANLALASGKVTGVSGSTLTVSGITRQPGAVRPTVEQVHVEEHEEAHRAEGQDRDAQDHDGELDHGERHPDGSVD